MSVEYRQCALCKDVIYVSDEFNESEYLRKIDDHLLWHHETSKSKKALRDEIANLFGCAIDWAEARDYALAIAFASDASAKAAALSIRIKEEAEAWQE